MHLVVNHVKRGDKTYAYARIVQSYRDKDGKVAHKVLANLGSLDPLQLENFKTALQASRDGKSVVLAEPDAAKIAPIPIEKSLQYLDIATLLHVWGRLELPDLLRQLCPQDPEHAFELVLFSLVAQRCVAPGSKLSACTWFPDTALPELTGIEPARFNNTRVHRTLELLAASEDALLRNLPLLLRSQRGPVAAAFLDVTDTWFEGIGPDLAGRGRTKEGLRNRRKIGIVLLCDTDGFPLRWSVIPGKTPEATGMRAHIDALRSVSWLGDAPVIADRAMGQLKEISHFLLSGLKFLTAVPRSQIDTHLDQLPAQPFFDFVRTVREDPSDEQTEDPQAAQDAFDADAKRLRTLAVEQGLTQCDNTLFVKDFGVLQRPLGAQELPWVGPQDIDPEKLTGVSSLLAWARIFRRLLDSHLVKNRAALAAEVEVSRARITEIMNLLKLEESLQDELLAGQYGPLAEHRVREVLKLEGLSAQRAALQALAQDPEIRATGRRLRPKKVRTTQTLPVRYVVYFNPEMYLSLYLKVDKARRSLDTFLDELNGRLRSPWCRMTHEDASYELRRKLDDLSLRSLYTPTVEEVTDDHARTHLRVQAAFDDKAWDRQRRYFGFVLLIGHPELPQTAEALARLYRAKDAVEQDFRVIKDQCEIRPVFHHTDPKVRAHVSVCMLALLLKRALETRLRAAGVPMTARACLERLASCRLNRHEPHAMLKSLYTVTRPDLEQAAVLKALGLTHLTEDRKVGKALRPRPA
jgi:transposase